MLAGVFTKVGNAVKDHKTEAVSLGFLFHHKQIVKGGGDKEVTRTRYGGHNKVYLILTMIISLK